MSSHLRNRGGRGEGGGFSVSVCGQEREDIEQLSRDGSHYSLSTGVLPSLGARSNRRVKLRKFIISPYDHHYRCMPPFSVSLKRVSFFSVSSVFILMAGMLSFLGIINVLLDVGIFKTLRKIESGGSFSPVTFAFGTFLFISVFLVLFCFVFLIF